MECENNNKKELKIQKHASESYVVEKKRDKKEKKVGFVSPLDLVYITPRIIAMSYPIT